MTHFLAIKSLNVSKRYDLALTFGEVLEGRADSLRQQTSDHPILSVFDKVFWWSDPMTAFVESVWIDCSLEAAQWKRAVFPYTSRARTIDRNLQEPCLD